jgi:hypothetical protein
VATLPPVTTTGSIRSDRLGRADTTIEACTRLKSVASLSDSTRIDSTRWPAGKSSGRLMVIVTSPVSSGKSDSRGGVISTQRSSRPNTFTS